MNKLLKVSIISIFCLTFVPSLVFADTASELASGDFQIVPCDGVSVNGQGVECDYNALIGGINKIVKYFLYIANFFAIAMFMYAGFLYMFKGDNAGVVEKAKNIFKSILIGLFFVYSAWLIVYTLLDKLIPDDSKIIPAGQTKDDVIQLK